MHELNFERMHRLHVVKGDQMTLTQIKILHSTFDCTKTLTVNNCQLRRNACTLHLNVGTCISNIACCRNLVISYYDH